MEKLRGQKSLGVGFPTESFCGCSASFDLKPLLEKSAWILVITLLRMLLPIACLKEPRQCKRLMSERTKQTATYDANSTWQKDRTCTAMDWKSQFLRSVGCCKAPCIAWLSSNL
eukprot:5141400-Amphidinium_carterae.1